MHANYWRKKPDAVPEQLLEIEQASRQNLKMVREIVAGLRAK